MTEKGKDSIKNIQDAFGSLLKDYHLDSKYQATRIKTLWEDIMGKPIASRTTSISLHNSRLKVKVTSAPLKNELNMSKTRILEILEKEFGKGVIEDIIFV
jgi:hypothetical protein